MNVNGVKNQLKNLRKKIRGFFATEIGAMAFHVLWSAIILFEFWLHPVLIFPTMLFKRELQEYDWNPFDMSWSAWKEWLIPAAIYAPIHIAFFG